MVSLNILPKYSPTIPNNNICIPEKNNINNIIAWNACIGSFIIIDFAITYINYTPNVAIVGIAIYVESLNGKVVKEVIPSIAKSTNFV